METIHITQDADYLILCAHRTKAAAINEAHERKLTVRQQIGTQCTLFTRFTTVAGWITEVIFHDI